MHEFMERHISAFPCFHLLFIDYNGRGDSFVSPTLVHLLAQGRTWTAADCRSSRMLIAMPVTVYQVPFCRTHDPGLALIHLAPHTEITYRAPPCWE